MINTRNNTYTVQAFIRGIIGFLSLLLLSILLVLPLGAISSTLFGTSTILSIPAFVFVLWLSSIIAKMFYILPEWEKMVLLRLGKFYAVRGAGLFVIPPFIYSVAAIVDMRIETRQVEATATLTKDNVPTKVTAALEFRVEDPKKATIDVVDYKSTVIWLSTEALKNTIGSMDLKELLSDRDVIAESLRKQIDDSAAVYGIDVRAVRLTDIDTPQTLIEELAVIARARRAAEAKKLQANAEVEVAQKIKEATDILKGNEHAMRLRELQTINEMSKEESSMIIIYPYGDRSGAEIAHAINNPGKSKAKTKPSA